MVSLLAVKEEGQNIHVGIRCFSNSLNHGESSSIVCITEGLLYFAVNWIYKLQCGRTHQHAQCWSLSIFFFNLLQITFFFFPCLSCTPFPPCFPLPMPSTRSTIGLFSASWKPEAAADTKSNWSPGNFGWCALDTHPSEGGGGKSGSHF